MEQSWSDQIKMKVTVLLLKSMRDFILRTDQTALHNFDDSHWKQTIHPIF